MIPAAPNRVCAVSRPAKRLALTAALLLPFCAVMTAAEDAAATLREANRYFENFSYSQARNAYDRALDNPAFASLPMPRPLTGEAAASASAVEERERYVAERSRRQTERERACYMRARCSLELAGDDGARLLAAAQEFRLLRDNVRGFEHPVYSEESRFWMGLAYLRAGSPCIAAGEFEAAREVVASAELDAKISWSLAESLRTLAGLDESAVGRVLQEAANYNENSRIAAKAMSALLRLAGQEPETDGKKLSKQFQDAFAAGGFASFDRERLDAWREELRRQAAEQLSGIITRHSGGQNDGHVELALMELRIELGQYADAADEAKSFLENPQIPPAARAGAILVQAQCAQRLGETEEAVRQYDRLLGADNRPETATAVSALYGASWCLSGLAKASGGELSQKYLLDARQRLEQALKLMNPRDPRRESARYLLTDLLVDLREYREALDAVMPLLQGGEWTVRANYLAGKAYAGIGYPDRALEHFERSYVLLGEDTLSQFKVDVLLDMAATDEDKAEQDFASALLYYRRAADAARALRNLAAEALARMGEARALVGLGAAAPEMVRRSAVAAGDALEAVLRTRYGGRENLAAALKMFKRKHEALRLWLAAGPGNCAAALQKLSLLQQRFGSRIRDDELYYYEGAALAITSGEAGEKLLKIADPAADSVKQAFDLYDSAAEKFSLARQANPRGELAPAASLGLARALTAKGRVAQELSVRLTSRLREKEALPLREEGRKLFKLSVQHYLDALETAIPGSSAALQSRLELGGVYYELEEFGDAAKHYRLLADNPDTGEELRIAATIGWAKALDRLNFGDEAVEKLNAYVGKSLEAAILAGRLCEKQNRPRDAFEKYSEGLKSAAASKTADGASAAEAGFLAYSLALRDSVDIAGKDSAAALERSATAGLGRVFAQHPLTEWAGRSALAAGEYYLRRNDWVNALEVARAVRTGAEATAENLQVADIIEGRARLLSGDARLAAGFFKNARGAEAADNPRIGDRVALATLLLGDAELAAGRTDSALISYNDVIAAYDDTSYADEARARLALLHAREAVALRAAGKVEDAAREFADALALLEKGKARQLMLETQKQIEAMRDARK